MAAFRLPPALSEFFCALGFVAALCAAPGFATAQELVKVKSGVITTASTAAMLVGAQKGIFRKYGFDVEVVPLATGVHASQALAANQVNWSGSGIESTIVAWGAGLPYRAYAMYAKGGDAFGVLVRKDSGIQSYKDLKGKRVAVTIGTALSQGLSQILLGEGLPGDAAMRVNATLSGMGPLLVQGSVDAMVGLEPFVTLTKEKMGDDAVLIGRLGKYLQGGGFFAISNEWAAAHRDRVPKVIEALWESHHYVRHNRSEASALVAAFLKTEQRIIDISFDYYQFNPLIDDFTQESIGRTIEYLSKEGTLGSKVEAKQHLADALRIEAALRQSRPDLLK